MQVSDILAEKGSRVLTVRPDQTVLDVVELLAANRIGAVIVEDSWMKPVGIVSERDFVRVAASHGAGALQMTVDAVMTRGLVTCPPSERIDTALATMTRAKIRHLPVVEGGRLLGIVSIGDLVKHRLDEKALEAEVLLERARMRA